MIKRNEEIIDFPCREWIDETGKVWCNPTLAFMEKRGWSTYTAQVIPDTPEEIAAEKKSLIAAIANSARNAVESEANAALQDQMWANYKSSTPHEYVVANVNWGKAIYNAAENRKAQVEAGVADDYATLTDFSSFGPKPYTVYQLYLAGVVEM